MDRLKAETRGEHAATEAIPYSAAMVERRLPRDRFIGQLAAYRRIHAALDEALATSDHPAVRTIWSDDLRKTHLLDADLAHFGADDRTAPHAVLDAADRFATRIRAVANETPVALIGFLYVLEGSTLGATILRGHLAEAYGLEDGRGLSYQSPYGESPMPHWRAFREKCNAAVTDGPSCDVIVDAAREAFRRIGEVLGALSSDLVPAPAGPVR